MLKEFRDFIDRGDIVELAVGFIMGLAFSRVVTTFTERIVNPLIALLIPDLDSLEGLGAFAENGSLGAFIGELINFLIIALVVFLIARTYNRFRATQEEAPTDPPPDIVLLTEIRDSLRSR